MSSLITELNELQEEMGNLSEEFIAIMEELAIEETLGMFEEFDPDEYLEELTEDSDD